MKDSLLETYSDLVRDFWHPDNILKPDEITYGSSKVVKWICNKGHEWTNPVYKHGSKGHGCPICPKKAYRKKSLTDAYPDIVNNFWNYEKNDLDPNILGMKTQKKAWFKCENEHSIYVSIQRVIRCGCIQCKSFEFLYPNVCKKWNYEKNTINPSDIWGTSGKVVFWKCEQGHEWKGRICDEILKKRGCSECHRNKNLLHIKNPDIFRQLHPTLNKDIDIYNLTCGDHRKCVWVCVRNSKHIWSSTVYNRKRSDCCYCFGNAVNEENNLLALYPEVCKYWDYSRNQLGPENYLPKSEKKVWWICETGKHSWITKIDSKVNRDTECLVCLNRQVDETNCLSTVRKDVLEWWDYNKNLEFAPDEVTPGSGRYAWFQCEKGHSWRTRIIAFCNKGTRCGKCNESKGERECSRVLDKLNIEYSVQKTYPDLKNINKLKFDICIKIDDKEALIEYDGEQHFRSVDFFGGEKGFKRCKELDAIKNDYCKTNKIPLLRISYRHYNDIEKWINMFVIRLKTSKSVGIIKIY